VSTRIELQRLWETRVRGARQLYEGRRRELGQLVSQLGNGLPESLDSNELIREAAQRESLALDEYLQTLRTYAELVVSGKLPEEPKS
jgi:hypothetical protein